MFHFPNVCGISVAKEKQSLARNWKWKALASKIICPKLTHEILCLRGNSSGDAFGGACGGWGGGGFPLEVPLGASIKGGLGIPSGGPCATFNKINTVHVSLSLSLHIYMYMYGLYACLYKHVCICTQSCMYTYIDINGCGYIYIYIYIYMKIRKCVTRVSLLLN